MKRAKAPVFLILTICAWYVDAEQPAAPIIDVHIHAPVLAMFERLGGPAPIPHCVPMTAYPVPKDGTEWSDIFKSRKNSCGATWSPKTDDEVMQKSLEVMQRRNIYAVTSGAMVDRWKKEGGDRIIPSFSFGGGPDSPGMSEVRTAFERGKFKVFGELTAQYGGLAPDDPSLEPYWALMEELDVPVGIHIGTGPVGAPYLGFDRYRARLHSALLLEEVLIKHPRLRVYIMHAGWPMLDDLLAVLWTHPHVYLDTGAISWALPQAEFHSYLKRIVDAGFGKRILFGSDQMVWPETIELAIERIESAAFLSTQQKRDILFHNAARFLRLGQEQLAAMHAAKAVSFPTQDGGVVYGFEYGKGDRGVVLAHGGRFNKESWHPQATKLAASGFRVLAIDLRGYGESHGGPEGESLYHLDILAAMRFLRETGVKTVSLVGASFGGKAVAQASIHAKPAEIDRLILIAHSPIERPEQMNGRKLFVLSGDDYSGDNKIPRLPKIREQYERSAEPKKIVILDGDAHAQAIFETEQGSRLMNEILQFLTTP